MKKMYKCFLATILAFVSISAFASLRVGYLQMSSTRLTDATGPTGASGSTRAAVSAGAPSDGANELQSAGAVAMDNTAVATSHIYDIRAYGASTSASDNRSSIQAAIQAAIKGGGGTVTIPCGVWNIATAYDSNNFSALAIYNGAVAVELAGQMKGCAILNYTGTTPIHAIISAANTEPSSTWNGSTWTTSGWSGSPKNYQFGMTIRDLFLMGNTHVMDGLDAIRPAHEVFRDVDTFSVENACLYVMSGVANTYDSLTCSSSEPYQAGRPTIVVPLNGLVFDGYSGVSDASTTSVIDRPILETAHPRYYSISSIARSNNVVTILTTAAAGLPVGSSFAVSGVADPSYNVPLKVASISGTTITAIQSGANSSSSGGQIGGVNLWFMDMGGTTVNALQNSGGFQAFRIDAGSTDNIINSSLFENDVAPSAVVIVGYGNALNSAIFNTATLEISGHANKFNEISGNANVTITQGAYGNKIEGYFMSGGTITDNGADTTFSRTSTSNPGQTLTNFPQEQHIDPISTAVGTSYDTPAYGNGTYIAGKTLAVPIFTHSFITGKSWVALLKGSFTANGLNGAYNTFAPLTILTDSNNTVSGINGGTLNFQVDGTTGKFEMTASQNYLGFSGQIEFYPLSNYAAGNAPRVNIKVPGSIAAGAFRLSGTTFSVSGCGTATALVGGPTAGKFVAGSATCTPVITTGLTSANGYSCWMNDHTTASVKFQETAYTTATATFMATGTLGSRDTIDFGCLEF